MEVLRRFAAIAVADLRERTRATRFWVILGIVAFASWWCFPPPDAAWMTVSVDGQRGEYSSAWIGMTLALVYSTIMAWLGFYLVRGSLVRDFDTRVWQLLVATPMTLCGSIQRIPTPGICAASPSSRPAITTERSPTTALR